MAGGDYAPGYWDTFRVHERMIMFVTHGAPMKAIESLHARMGNPSWRRGERCSVCGSTLHNYRSCPVEVCSDCYRLGGKGLKAMGHSKIDCKEEYEYTQEDPKPIRYSMPVAKPVNAVPQQPGEGYVQPADLPVDFTCQIEGVWVMVILDMTTWISVIGRNEAERLGIKFVELTKWLAVAPEARGMEPEEGWGTLQEVAVAGVETPLGVKFEHVFAVREGDCLTRIGRYFAEQMEEQKWKVQQVAGPDMGPMVRGTGMGG